MFVLQASLATMSQFDWHAFVSTFVSFSVKAEDYFAYTNCKSVFYSIYRAPKTHQWATLLRLVACPCIIINTHSGFFGHFEICWK